LHISIHIDDTLSVTAYLLTCHIFVRS